MKLSEARSEVAKLNARLLETGLAYAVNPAVPSHVGERVRLTWPMATESNRVFSRFAFGSIYEYLAFLTGRHYTCFLADGALIQITYDFKGADLIGHRFCYYPCPILGLDKGYLTDADGWIDLLETELLDVLASVESWQDFVSVGSEKEESGLLRLRSPIRFDYDGDATREPMSHVHIVGPDVRIPVYAALSLGQFVRFVITYFYPNFADVLADFPVRPQDRCISADHEVDLYMNCRHPLQR